MAGVGQVQDILGTDWATQGDNHCQKVSFRRGGKMKVIIFMSKFWHGETKLYLEERERKRKAIPSGFI